MKLFLLLPPSIVLILALGLAGCHKEATVDATQSLEQSFQQAAPEVQQTIAVVNTSLNSGNYSEATRVLAPMVTQQRLTEPQKQAVGIALQQINRAIAKDPTLDTKEMYELRAKMFQSLQNGPRF